MKILEYIKFDDKGLIPAIIQDDKTKEVLTLCYMNKDAVTKTVEEGKVYVYRRSRKQLMMKGQTSGCIQTVKGISIDCDGNSVLIMVDQERAACHKGFFTCYFRRIGKDGDVEIIGKRVFNPEEVYKASK